MKIFNFDAATKALLSGAPVHREEGGIRISGHATAAECPPIIANALPRITVITALFNGGKTLEKNLLSVLGQSYSNIEHIVIDGGSTDDSLDILRRYSHRVDYWMSESDTGIYDAWNKGVHLATGDWIAFLGADDVYLDDAIERYVQYISEHNNPKLEFLSSRINLTCRSTILRTVGVPWEWRVFRRYMGVAHVGALHSKELFEKFGLFDDTYKICGDYEFLLRAGPKLQAGFVDMVSVNMEVGGVSDANIKVFTEAARAKVFTGNRSFLLSQIEKYFAILKWKLRKYASLLT